MLLYLKPFLFMVLTSDNMLVLMHKIAYLCSNSFINTKVDKGLTEYIF